MNDIYKNICDYNTDKARKIIIEFDDMIADNLSNKKPNQIITKLLIRGTKMNISVAFITQSYFVVPKNIKLNSTYYFFIKISSK